jgi:hypothetical protein
MRSLMQIEYVAWKEHFVLVATDEWLLDAIVGCALLVT